MLMRRWNGSTSMATSTATALSSTSGARPKGLVNQGWKDSWDANMHRDGTVAQPPIALSEVQGYVYDAKYRMSSLLRSFGDVKTADRLKKRSLELARRFDQAFWVPSRGFYAMALDAREEAA